MTRRELPIMPPVLVRPSNVSVPVRAEALWSPEIRATADDPETTIAVLGIIGEDLWDEGITAKRVSAELQRMGKRDVTVNINSPGGSFMEAVTIYNALRQHGGSVTVRILGIAGSAASIVAMAGDHIEIAKAGFIMIHNTHLAIYGDRLALREAADTMETFDRTLARLYADRSGLDASEITTMMDEETYFDGPAAIERGLADDLLPVDVVRREADAGASALRRIDNALAEAGWSRADRRTAFKELAGKPSAADNAMPGAGETAVDSDSTSLSIALARLKLARA